MNKEKLITKFSDNENHLMILPLNENGFFGEFSANTLFDNITTNNKRLLESKGKSKFILIKSPNENKIIGNDKIKMEIQIYTDIDEFVSKSQIKYVSIIFVEEIDDSNDNDSNEESDFFKKFDFSVSGSISTDIFELGIDEFLNNFTFSQKILYFSGNKSYPDDSNRVVQYYDYMVFIDKRLKIKSSNLKRIKDLITSKKTTPNGNNKLPVKQMKTYLNQTVISGVNNNFGIGYTYGI